MTGLRAVLGSPGRLRAVSARWLDVVLLALAGAGTSAIAAPLAWPLAKGSVADKVLAAPALLILALLCVPFARRRVRAWLGLRHLLSYPPPWVAAWAGFVVLCLFYEFNPGAFNAAFGVPADGRILSSPVVDEIGLTWSAFLGGSTSLAVLVFLLSSTRGGASEGHAEQGGQSPYSTFQSLMEWIRTDDEIVRRHQDAFGHYVVASRIASRLLQEAAAAKSSRTMALVGPLGSGKSSIRGLVEEVLSRLGHLGQDIEIVSVSVWPFETAEAAVHGILSKLTDVLSKHVSTLSISGLPDEYVHMIDQVAGTWITPKALTSSKTPSEILARYGQVTAAISLKVIVWIEDLERFAGVAVSTSPDPDDEKKLGPIRSVLHLLDQMDGISVVLASTSLRTRFDLDKLARFIEEPPRIELEHALALFRTFRRGCVAMIRGEGLGLLNVSWVRRVSWADSYGLVAAEFLSSRA